MHTNDRYYVVKHRHQEREAEASQERLARIAAEARRAERVAEQRRPTPTTRPPSHRPRLDWLARAVANLLPWWGHPAARAH